MSYDYVEDITEETLKSIVREPDYTGWLKKQGDKYKMWKSHYCILKGVNFYYIKNDKVFVLKVYNLIRLFIHSFIHLFFLLRILIFRVLKDILT